MVRLKEDRDPRITLEKRAKRNLHARDELVPRKKSKRCGEYSVGTRKTISIFRAIHDSNHFASPKCDSRIGWTAPCCPHGKRKDCPLACVLFGASGAGSARWSVSAAGCPKLRYGRVGGINRRLVLDLLGSVSTEMSTAGVGYTGLGRRRSRDGNGSRGAALGRSMTATFPNFIRSR